MINQGFQRQMQWLTVAVVAVVAVSFAAPTADASCGDYLHRRSIALPGDAQFLLYSGFEPGGSLSQNQLRGDGSVSSLAQSSVAASASSEVNGTLAVVSMASASPTAPQDVSGSDELLRRTECRGPHCQKSPTGGSNPVQIISVARDHQDLLDSQSIRSQQFSLSNLELNQNDSHETSRGYPLLPEIPPEPVSL